MPLNYTFQMWETWVLTGFQTTLFDLFQDNRLLSPICWLSTDLWSQRLAANQNHQLVGWIIADIRLDDIYPPAPSASP